MNRLQLHRTRGWRKPEGAVLASLPSLAGRDLLCFCPPGAPCHGDTLLAMANA